MEGPGGGGTIFLDEKTFFSRKNRRQNRTVFCRRHPSMANIAIGNGQKKRLSLKVEEDILSLLKMCQGRQNCCENTILEVENKSEADLSVKNSWIRT